ncbi:MAG: FISUMP domain-containing protein [Candidatus Gracilibacteria bacterium]|nr:FISUMP domain-containing protein [Candidatus Gracilibacteria bacterium]
MNKTLIKLGKNIVLQLVSFSILIGFVAFAAISWPSSTPTGETSGGKFASYFSKMLLGCPAGQVLKGFQSDGTRLCSQVGTSEIANNAIDQTKVQNGYVDLSSNQTIGGTKTFTNPVVGVIPTANNHLVTKQYVDNAIAVALSSTYSYSWDTGAYGTCSVSCGGGTQTRTVSCKRNDGTIVVDSFCSGTKPTTSQTCNINVCIPVFTCGENVSAGGYTYTTKLAADGKCWTSTNMKHTPSLGSSSCFGNKPANCDTYGRLYDWNAATDSSVCGALGVGWTLPTDVQLINLKNAGATGWKGGNKLSGLVSTISGFRYPDGHFCDMDGSYNMYYWTSTKYDINNAWSFNFHTGNSSIVVRELDTDYEFLSLCVKN